jgi:hypothetical protein
MEHNRKVTHKQKFIWREGRYKREEKCFPALKNISMLNSDASGDLLYSCPWAPQEPGIQ